MAVRRGPITVRFVLDGATSRNVDGPVEDRFVARVGFALPKRIGPATARNRLRRRIRSVVAATSAELPRGDYLISAGSGATMLSYPALQELLGSAIASVTSSRRRGGL